jgi:hypothetical protein
MSFPGFNVILMGPPGTGKTHALTTLADAGIETFVVFLENGLESLVGAYADRGKPVPPNLHWHNLPSTHRGFDAMRDMAEKLGKFDLKFIANYKDIKRSEFNRFDALYTLLHNFVDQHGESFGPVDKWGSDRVLCIDSLTGLSNAAMEMMTGDKPVRDKPDYGIAQHQVQTVLSKLSEGCLCHFVLTAHVEREVDEILGGVKLMPVTPGKAIKGTVSIPFSDVILTKREGDKFFWDTADSSADLKTRNLPIASKLPPDFGAIVARWDARRKAAGGAA